jgi:hypothetical protein
MNVHSHIIMCCCGILVHVPYGYWESLIEHMCIVWEEQRQMYMCLHVLMWPTLSCHDLSLVTCPDCSLEPNMGMRPDCYRSWASFLTVSVTLWCIAVVGASLGIPRNISYSPLLPQIQTPDEWLADAVTSLQGRWERARGIQWALVTLSQAQSFPDQENWCGCIVIFTVSNNGRG